MQTFLPYTPSEHFVLYRAAYEVCSYNLNQLQLQALFRQKEITSKQNNIKEQFLKDTQLYKQVGRFKNKIKNMFITDVKERS